MTNEEAIKEIEQSGLYGNQVHQETLELALSALRAQQERENPKPLTLEQLKERVGKPVWATYFDGSGARWGIVSVSSLGVCAVVDYDTAYWFTDMCKCIAYDYPPAKEKHRGCATCCGCELEPNLGEPLPTNCPQWVMETVSAQKAKEDTPCV